MRDRWPILSVQGVLCAAMGLDVATTSRDLLFASLADLIEPPHDNLEQICDQRLMDMLRELRDENERLKRRLSDVDEPEHLTACVEHCCPRMPEEVTLRRKLVKVPVDGSSLLNRRFKKVPCWILSRRVGIGWGEEDESVHGPVDCCPYCGLKLWGSCR